jgi:hypothetical protein
MEGLTSSEGHFPHNRKSRKTPSPAIMTNGISYPSEINDMSLDLTISPFDGKSSLSPSPIISLLRGSWHPHQFSKAPGAPTPFGIKDILGWGGTTKLDDNESFPPPPPSPAPSTVRSTQDENDIKEDDDEVEGEDEVKHEEEMLSESSSPPLMTPPSPEPLSMESDEPLNLTVGKRETPRSSASPSNEKNNNQLTNGSETHFTANRPFIRDKSPTAALLPNNVIIPKVKPPKSSAVKNGTAKNSSKGTDQSF